MNSLLRSFKSVCAVLVLVLASVLFIANSHAQGTDTKYWSAPSRAIGATNFYVIVPAMGDRVAIVRTLEVTTDLTAARVTTYTNGNQVEIPYAISSTGTNIQVASTGTNGLAAGEKVVIHTGNTPNDIYYLASLHSVGTTNLALSGAAGAIAAGARLWRIGTNTFFYGMTNGATSPRNSFVAVGERGRPLVITVNAGAAGSLNAVGDFSADK